MTKSNKTQKGKKCKHEWMPFLYKKDLWINDACGTATPSNKKVENVMFVTSVYCKFCLEKRPL